MLKKYVTLVDENMTERNVFREQYSKVIMNIAPFEENT